MLSKARRCFMAKDAKSHTPQKHSLNPPLSRGRNPSTRHLPLSIFFFLLSLSAFACSSQPQASTQVVSATLLASPTLPPLPSLTPAETLANQINPTPLSTEALPPAELASPFPSEPATLPTVTSNREFDAFVLTVMNGNPNEIVGVYVENVLALRVVQQPSNDPAWVSTNDGEATEFLLAFVYAGNIGLLAHNYLAGRYFFNLEDGDIVQLIYGDGSVFDYEISQILEYQALQPESVDSDFVDLLTGETLTATNLFYTVYGGDHHLTFQTCIDRDNNSEWGRLFPMAYPIQ
jgi:hypothetical protein